MPTAFLNSGSPGHQETGRFLISFHSFAKTQSRNNHSIMIRNHSKPFLFKMLVLNLLVTFGYAKDGEWKTLFNGKNLDGWEFRGGGNEPPTFEVKNGEIVGSTKIPGNKTAFVCTTEQYKDFELLFDVKVDKDLNSGVQIRSTPTGTVRGAQVEIQNGSPKTGNIFGQGMGMWLTEEITPGNKAYKSGEWNTFRVLVQGKTIKTWINDQPITTTTHDKVASEGIIGLQVHGYPRGKNREKGAKEVLSARWKNIKIRKLSK